MVNDDIFDDEVFTKSQMFAMNNLIKTHIFAIAVDFGLEPQRFLAAYMVHENSPPETVHNWRLINPKSVPNFIQLYNANYMFYEYSESNLNTRRTPSTLGNVSAVSKEILKMFKKEHGYRWTTLGMAIDYKHLKFSKAHDQSDAYCPTGSQRGMVLSKLFQVDISLQKNFTQKEII